MADEAQLLTPALTVADSKKARIFYEQAFGLEMGVSYPSDSEQPIHTSMHYKGKQVFMFSPEDANDESGMRSPKNSGYTMPIVLMLYCEDVDALTVRAQQAGATLQQPPTDMFWGDRNARLVDPDGYVWTLATRIHQFDPNEGWPPAQ